MEIWVLIVPLWPGLLSWEVKQALSYISPWKVTQTRREGAGLPEQGQLHSLIFLVTNTHLLLLLASSTLGDPESLGRWERLVVSGTWLQGDLEGHTPPQAKASSLGTGRHLRAALSDTEPHFSCLYLSITLLWPLFPGYMPNIPPAGAPILASLCLQGKLGYGVLV